jgi:hypothetical protein
MDRRLAQRSTRLGILLGIVAVVLFMLVFAISQVVAG